MNKKLLRAMEGKRHDAKPPYSRRRVLCDLAEAERLLVKHQGEELMTFEEAAGILDAVRLALTLMKDKRND